MAPETVAADIELRLVDPANNKRRLYGLTETVTLFGERCLRIVWGRIGHRKLRERDELFSDAKALDARRRELLARRRRHGYRPVETRSPRRLNDRADTALSTVLAPPATPAAQQPPAALPRSFERMAARVTSSMVDLEVLEAHGMRLRDALTYALVEQWYRATRDLIEYLAERRPEHLDLVDASTLAAMFAGAAGIA